MADPKLVCVVAIAVILIIAFGCKKSDRADFSIPSMAPSPAVLIPSFHPRSGGLTMGVMRGSATTDGVDFASAAESTLTQTVKDNAVADYLTVQEMMPDQTMAGLKPSFDEMDTRQVSVQMRSKYWSGANPWVISPKIDPVHSIHRFTDADKDFDHAQSAYDHMAEPGYGNNFAYDLRVI